MLVKGEGPLDAKIWLVGEAPGATEELKGRPFCGGSGWELDKILKAAGIKREECYIDNVIQTRPPSNDFSVFYKDKAKTQPTEALSQGHERINNLINLHRPNVVCALGNEALYALTNKKAITKWRGSILGCRGVKVIPSIHPAMVMRQYEYYPIACFDLKRVKEESLSPTWPSPYNDTFILSPSFEQIMETLDKLELEKYVCFDIETQQNQIVCIGFGWSKTEAACIPIAFGGNSWWTLEQEHAIISRIRKLFLSSSVKFIAQNAQFDMIYLQDAWGVQVPNLWMDTMIAFHCIYPELPKGLDFLSSIYTHRPYHKDDAYNNPGPDGLWHYNCLDTVVTWECAMAIHQEMQEFGTLKFYEENSHKLIAPLIKMQRRGVRIDETYRAKLDVEMETKTTELQAKVDGAVGHPLNVNSPLQMKNFLYKELGLPEQTKRKTGSITADEDAIEKLSKQFPNPLFEIFIEIRHIRKVLSTYVRAPLDGDGRLRTSYVITGTTSGRLASRGSVYGTGTNLQNIDRDIKIRRMFIADEGYKFINADLSQAEARVVAFIAREDRLKAVFAEGGDIHKRNASIIFHKPISIVSDEERQLAKTLVHAANYGIGVRKFAQTIGSTEDKARQLLNLYHANYPRIRMWHMEVEAQLRKSRILETPLGRKRMFFNRWGPDLTREAIAYVPQSTVGDVLNLGIIRCANAMPQGWEMIMQNHDAVLMQVPLGADPQHIIRFLKHYFEFPIEINGERLVIPIDIKEGVTWGDLKKVEVPLVQVL